MAGKKEPTLRDFIYVDAYHTDENGKSSPWKRIEAANVLKFQQEEAYNFNCFASVQRFAGKDRARGEVHIAPLYFDFDNETDPKKSQADAVRLIEFFTEELDVQPTDIWAYFSGSKGFHILVNSQALGIAPRGDLHKIYKHIAGYLVHRLGLESLDLVVYTLPRMLRLPNSVHHKTRLFKVQLSIDELRTKSLGEIRDLARMPRKEGPFTSDEREADLRVRTKAAELFADKAKEYAEAAATAATRYDKDEYHFKKGQPPVCVTDILTNGWKKDGDRNQATIQLACYFKDAGHSKDEALAELVPWVTKHTSAGSDYGLQQRVANTRSVVDSVYSGDNQYRFGCAFIRSLHGPKAPGDKDYDRVACAGDLCPCIKKKNVSTEKAVSLHLSQTGDADLTGKLVKSRVMVAGMKHTPFIVPKKIEYHCWGREGCKKQHCPLYDIPAHTQYKDLGVQDRELIQMTGIGDDNIKGILRELSGIPNCAKYNVEVVESTNVDELVVIPMAETDKPEDEVDGTYVLRRIYTIGGLRLSENKYYEIAGYVFPHPKTAEATLLVKEAMPLQDKIEGFKLDDGARAMLAAFQPADYTAEAIEEKVVAICSDLTYNVTHIVERDETLLGVLLTYHSALRFSVPWNTDTIRGWVELMIVGDTATGKSELVNKLQRFVGLGARVNAESTSRTGLTYKIEQSGTGGAWYIIWGAWPRSDKEMIWVDEATGITKDEYGEMTLARSDGKLEVKRAVTAETPCRVRVVMTSNAVKGNRLGSYGQGVESLKDIFNNEDIRRFDLAIFMRSNDVDPEQYNQELPTYPSMITAEALKASILFAWSRKPDDITFFGGALDKVLEVATDLSKVYGNAVDVPLVSPADQRNKVARLAVALAALTHSVDESGERIVVHPGHVTFIGEYLKAIYNAPGCGLNYYARLALKEEDLTEERFNKLTADLKKLDTLKGDHKYYEFIKLFAQQRYLRLGDVEAMLSIDKEESKAIINQLVKMRMIINTSGGFRKTPRFNGYIGKCFEMGLFDDIDEEY